MSDRHIERERMKFRERLGDRQRERLSDRQRERN